MDALVRQGVTSFKLFMAYPGVFMLDDAQHLQGAAADRARTAARSACTPRTAASSTCWCSGRSPKGKTAPKYHALTRPARAEAEATHRAIALAEIADVPIYIVHLSAAEALEMVTEARDRGLPAFAETCPQYLFLSYDNYEEPGFDGAKYVMSPPLRDRRRSRISCGAASRSTICRHLDRPLPVLHEGAEGARRERLLEDSERRAGHRDAHEPGLRRRRAAGPHLAQPLRRADVDLAGEDLRAVPAQGHDRARLGRRHRRLRSEPDDHAVGEDAAHERATTTRTKDAR